MWITHWAGGSHLTALASASFVDGIDRSFQRWSDADFWCAGSWVRLFARCCRHACARRSIATPQTGQVPPALTGITLPPSAHPRPALAAASDRQMSACPLAGRSSSRASALAGHADGPCHQCRRLPGHPGPPAQWPRQSAIFGHVPAETTAIPASSWSARDDQPKSLADDLDPPRAGQHRDTAAARSAASSPRQCD